VHHGRSAQLWTVEIRRSSDQELVARGQVRFHVLSELPNKRGKS
jgi:acyl-coenzyme A thioesterase PaaI-like protein